MIAAAVILLGLAVVTTAFCFPHTRVEDFREPTLEMSTLVLLWTLKNNGSATVLQARNRHKNDPNNKHYKDLAQRATVQYAKLRAAILWSMIYYVLHRRLRTHSYAEHYNRLMQIKDSL